MVEIHRSTNPTDVPDQMKITTTAVTTTTTATVTTTGKSPPSGNTVQLDNVVFGTEIDLSAFDYTNITEIALKISDLASGGDGQVHIHPNYKSYQFADAESDGLIHIKLTPPTSSKLIIYRYNGTGGKRILLPHLGAESGDPEGYRLDGSITVCNTPSKTTGVVMPSTSGSGTFTYQLIGISLMTAAAGLFVLRRQKQFRSSA